MVEEGMVSDMVVESGFVRVTGEEKSGVVV